MSWDAYLSWNSAIADVVFSTDMAGVPVYLDLEDEVLAAIARRAVGVCDDAEDELVRAVAATIDPTAPPGSLFRAHREALRRWERQNTGYPPPHLGLLAVLSLAAERMSGGDGFAANNYYGRLAPMLGMQKRQHELTSAYRREAQWFWAALNRWLVHLDGARGLPTAYSLSQSNQQYVGLPISQALVRTADREGLVRFFQRVGFAPGSDVPPHSLMPLLDAWIRTTPSPATKSLQRMWTKPTARDRVAEVAAIALASWDGAARGKADAEGTDESLRLIATVGGLLKPRLELGVIAYLERPDLAREVTVTTSDGAPLLQAQPGVSGAMHLSGTEQTDIGALLDGVLTIRDSLTDRLVTRRPRRLVPFRMNDLLQQLTEADQVQAGEQLVLLVERSLLERLTQLLDEVARPGWKIAANLKGVPDRWAVVRDVEIITRPANTPSSDLTCLVPLTQSHMSLSKGFALPGRLRRWHSWDAPEITALDEPGTELSITLTSACSLTDGPSGESDEASAISRKWDSETPGFLSVDLQAEGLDDGDYRVELFRGDDKTPASSLVLRLRSGDLPDDLQWAQAPELGHDPQQQPITMITARSAAVVAPAVRGASVLAPAREGKPTTPSTATVKPWWESGAPAGTNGHAASWAIAPPAPDSCMLTGRHVLLVPDALPGRPSRQFVDSTCRGCGLVKRVATTPWAARRRDDRSRAAAATPLDVHKVAPANVDAADKWVVAMDAIAYLGGGSFSLLERLALQVEGSALAVDQLVRTLEVLGHIEVERDPKTLSPVSWEISPTTLAETTADLWSLVGYWPSDLTSALQRVVEAAGGELITRSPEVGPASWFAKMPAGAALPDLSEVGEILIVPSAAERLADQLVPLSSVVRALPRRSADLVGEVTAFSPVSATWLRTQGLGGPGAYRVRRWQTLDLIRTPEDVNDGTAALSTVQLSKHVAALGCGRPLLAYDPETRELTVPLGADLPGLYGRAAVLSSGMPPTAVGRRLVYSDVTPDVASSLVRSLCR